ncbi:MULTISPECIES: hypothetical protein [Streptomyces]|uniref:hypothetical protein n=1 Tax=Streptomyces TaxID=1883 RepID=UPI0024A0B730|nr:MULTISPECIES: hypothetical protein [Streptomyces]GLW03801.1 hypothetical protein Slala05_74310 [Streptomyces lavendulae subsp. lavendulae]
MTSNTELLLRQLVEETALEITDADYRFRKRDLVQAVRSKLDHVDLGPDTLAIALDKLADNAVTGFGDQRNPRRRGPGSFFHPDDILKLGNGVWVWMRRATDSDLVAWRKQSRRNRVHVDAADNELQDYADDRLDAFRTSDGIVYLEDLERVVFHWTEDSTTQSGLF